ncbi:MAG: VWA domain-containing protein [Planctomycetota bacterium]|nr:MAG: VWA domain-containing protein [Planctomycetota bacterium]
MFTWVAQHFLNPAFFWPGVALVSVPILIHLINRLHYRKVRFAAMEFLLASEQKNRRRVLLEQLLLLLLRILMVLLLTALIARMVLSASQLSLFQGAKSHHLVLLDDSGSMRDRVGETAAFDEARAVIRKLVSEGANRPGTQKFTLLLTSRPDQTLAGLSERDINDELVDEVSTRLEDLTCTHQAVDMAAALEAARSRLVDDATDIKHLHVISDFRRPDWFDNKAVAGALTALDEENVSVNLVRSVGETHENLALVDLSGEVEVAAAGVPVRFKVKVANYGTREAEGVRVSLAVDGRNVPRNLVFETIDAGGEEEREFDIVFDTAGPHHVQALLESDSLEQDNVRHLAVDVPNDNPVLIIDATPGSDQGQYVADALAADKSVTGYAPTGAGLDYLRQYPLDGFHLIYLINVPELPADALAALETYVAEGGGLAWFLGNAVRPAFYNDKLYNEGAGLFPAPLANSTGRLERDLSQTAGPDIQVTDHPLFRILAGQENPFLDLVFVNDYFPLDQGWLFETLPDSTDVEVIARLRNRAPLILEHDYGQGRIVTCLTSAGPLQDSEGLPWNNWANGPAAPSYAVFQLDLAKYIARRDRALPRKTVGEPITETFSRVLFLDQVEFVNPNNQVTQVRAGTLEPHDSEDAAAGDEVRPLSATFRETDDPGVYAVRMTTQNREQQERWIAYNVPASESELAVVSDDQIRAEAGDAENLTIQQAGVFDWIRSDSPGEDVRWLLLFLLVLVGVCEQALAYRLSYHPR